MASDLPVPKSQNEPDATTAKWHVKKNWSSPYFPDYPLVLWTILTLFGTAMLAYAVTIGFVWDEGFHLLAAQLINKGRVPYLDFCFPQTPLNAYWNAAWMRWTGGGWRVAHVLAAIASFGATALAAEYVFRRQTGKWRFPAALLAGLAVITNQTLWKFGTCAQAYGAGTFLSVLAFRIAVASISKPSVWPAAFAGLSAGAAAACTLLTAPVLPVIFGWLLFWNYAGSRWRKALSFLVASVVPFTPVLVLFVRGPRQTFFNVVRYQALFRRSNWPGATAHDFQVTTAWVADSAVFAVALLAIAGVVWAKRWSGTSLNRRAEIYLCGLLGGSLTLYIATTHPTFERYFVFAIPFLAILSAIGFVTFTERLGWNHRPFWPVLASAIFLTISLARALFDDREATTWNNYVHMTNRVREVTPARGKIFVDEHIYFLLDQIPPSGMEFSYSRRMEVPKDEEKLYHIQSEREWVQRVQSGEFATVESCKDELIDKMRLNELFPQQQDFEDCTVFWGPVRPLKSPAPKPQSE